MVLRTKNFNILGFTERYPTFTGGEEGGGGLEKPIYRGTLPKKGGAWTICWFKGAWQERGGGVFE